MRKRKRQSKTQYESLLDSIQESPSGFRNIDNLLSFNNQQRRLTRGMLHKLNEQNTRLSLSRDSPSRNSVIIINDSDTEISEKDKEDASASIIECSPVTLSSFSQRKSGRKELRKSLRQNKNRSIILSNSIVQSSSTQSSNGENIAPSETEDDVIELWSSLKNLRPSNCTKRYDKTREKANFVIDATPNLKNLKYLKTEPVRKRRKLCSNSDEVILLSNKNWKKGQNNADDINEKEAFMANTKSNIKNIEYLKTNKEPVQKKQSPCHKRVKVALSLNRSRRKQCINNADDTNKREVCMTKTRSNMKNAKHLETNTEPPQKKQNPCHKNVKVALALNNNRNSRRKGHVDNTDSNLLDCNTHSYDYFDTNEREIFLTNMRSHLKYLDYPKTDTDFAWKKRNPYYNSDKFTLSSNNGRKKGHNIDNVDSYHSKYNAQSYEKEAKTNVSDEQDNSKSNPKLREIIVDGCNVGMAHAKHQMFSVKGIKLIVDYFVKRGHVVKVFLPNYLRKYALLEELYQEGIVVFTPSRNIEGRQITPYDDRFILEYATACEGIVISSDQFRDLYEEKPEWRDTISNRLLEPTFVGDYIMFPEDPLGKSGPNLETFLQH